MVDNTVRQYTFVDSSLGRLVIQASAMSICGVWYDDGDKRPDDAGLLVDINHLDKPEAFPILKEAVSQLGSYFNGELRSFNLSLTPEGTDFQKRVWQALLEIPYGQTCSYQDIANAIGQPKAVRAVGLANGRNPISIIIPCHRVIGKNGQLTGYTGGLDKKITLLALEQKNRP